MAYRNKRRNILIVLVVMALALTVCAVLFTACNNRKEKDVTDGTTSYGTVNIIDDSGTLDKAYSVPVGTDVYTFMQDYVPVKDHAEFAYWICDDGTKLTQGSVTMTESVTLTAVYGIEITLRINARDVDTETGTALDTYTHMEPLDVVVYDLAGSTYKADVVTFDYLSEESGKNTNLTITVSSDYTKNVIDLYYTRRTFSVDFITNYPSDSGLADSDKLVTNLYFGYPVSLPTGYTCEGYLMLGWSETSRAEFADYAVDSVTEDLWVWNSSEHVYEKAVSSEEETVMYPYKNTVLYITWAKAYTDMFGGNDYIFLTEEDADYVYLCRDGQFWRSTDMRGVEYWFANDYTGNTQYYRVKLSDNHTFSYYSSTRLSGNYYLFSYTMVDGTFGAVIDEDEYVYFDQHDGIVYVSSTGESSGTYELLDGMALNATFTSGPLSGQTRQIILGETTTGAYIFMVCNEEEAAMGAMPLGTVTYGDTYARNVATYYVLESDYTTPYYCFLLDGFGYCSYYVAGSYYTTYYYYLDGDMLYLYGYSSSSGYVLSGQFKYVLADGGGYAWFQYYSTLDGEFGVYDAAGEDVIGRIVCDGYLNVSFTAINNGVAGTTVTGYYGIESLVLGTAVTISGTGIETDADYSIFVRERKMDENGNSVKDNEGNYIYCMRLIPSTYMEIAYRADGDGVYNEVILLNCAGEGTAAFYIVGYSSAAGGWYYFPVLYGTYEKCVSDTYGSIIYYVFTVTEGVDDTEYFEELGVSGFTSVLGESADFSSVTQFAFALTYVTDGYYYYYASTWLWCDTGEVTSSEGTENDTPWASDTAKKFYEEYTGENLTMTFECGDSTIEGIVENGQIDITGKYSFILFDGTSIGGNIAISDTSMSGTLGIYGEINEEIGSTSQLYLVVFGTLTISGNEYSINGYTYVYVTLGDDGTISLVTTITETIYEATVSEGTKTSYISYNTLDESGTPEYTYYDGGETHTGTISLDSSATAADKFGHEIYTFTETNGSTTFSFIYATVNGSRVFIKYSQSDTAACYTGTDNSSVKIDSAGYYAIYTDVYGAEYKVNFNYFTVEKTSGTGSTGYGYIEIRSGSRRFILDFNDSNQNTYTVRGEEYGEYTLYGGYYVVNELVDEYVVELDGYGKVGVSNAEGESIGSGTYSLMDTVITLSFTVSGGESTSYEIEGELDRTSYSVTGRICVNEMEYEATYINNKDWSVVTLRENGTATRYLSDGTVETGAYSWLDETYFCYENDGATSSSVYRKMTELTVVDEDYSKLATRYYTSDLGECFEFTSDGKVSFDGENYFIYVADDYNRVTIYYVPDPKDVVYANECGYMTHTFGQLGSTYTATDSSTTYYNISYVTNLYRRSGEEDQYHYTNIAISNSTQTIGRLDLSSWNASTADLTATMYLGTTGSQYAYLYVKEEEDESGESAKHVYMLVYTHYYSYYDYLFYIYDLTVDLSGAVYSITGERYYVYTVQYEAMYDLYNYGEIYTTHYSTMYLVWDVASDGQTATVTADGELFPYLFTDPEDSTKALFTLESESVYTDSDGYCYIYFESTTGDDYQLIFYIGFDSVSNTLGYYYNMGYFMFVTVSFGQYASYDSAKDDDGNFYRANIMYTMYSSSSYGWLGYVSVALYQCANVGNVEYSQQIELLDVFILDGSIYCLQAGVDENTSAVESTYYKIVITVDSVGEHSMSVLTTDNGITSYAITEYGLVDVYTYTDDGGEHKQVLYICLLTSEGYMYYYALSTVENDDGTLTVELGDGNTYKVTIQDTRATIEIVTEES